MTTQLEDTLARALHTLTRLRDIVEPKEKREAWSAARSALAAYRRAKQDETPALVDGLPHRESGHGK